MPTLNPNHNVPEFFISIVMKSETVLLNADRLKTQPSVDSAIKMEIIQFIVS